MTIKYFGKIAEITNCIHENWDVSEMNIEEFKNRLIEKYPILDGGTMQIAVNLKIAEPNYLLKSEDEIAILPPFSGG